MFKKVLLLMAMAFLINVMKANAYSRKISKIHNISSTYHNRTQKEFLNKIGKRQIQLIRKTEKRKTSKQKLKKQRHFLTNSKKSDLLSSM